MSTQEQPTATETSAPAAAPTAGLAPATASATKVTAREINETIRYTCWAVFAAAERPDVPHARQGPARGLEGLRQRPVVLSRDLPHRRALGRDPGTLLGRALETRPRDRRGQCAGST